MRAAILKGTNEFHVEDVTPHDPGPRDVVVRVDASGVCHSDLTVLRSNPADAPPTIMGHEGTGVVEHVGPEVTSLRVGDRVVGAFVPACGACWFCLRGQSYLCLETSGYTTPRAKASSGEAFGFAGLGTFAEAMTCHEASLVKVETDLPPEQLALIGCGVTTGVGAALNAAHVEPGSSVAVIGCGGVGQAVIQGARIAGAAKIVAVDPVASKREIALAFGASDGVDPNEADPVEQVKALTGGRGADYAFEVIGRPETMLQAFRTTRRGGTTVIVGMSPSNDPIQIPAREAFLGARTVVWTLYGSSLVRRDFQRWIELVETDRLDLGDMVTRTIGLDDIDDAFRAMEAGEVIRSVIR